MKQFRSLSLWTCIICLAAFITTRILTAPEKDLAKVKVIHWDAAGLYLYLPGTFIYHDLKQMAWYPKIDSTYGTYYQSPRAKNGNYVMKYMTGIALMNVPFFFLAHYTAPYFHYPQDGFSPPYQIAICLASILYSFLGLLALRKVLRYYFNEKVTAISLLLVALASNFIQYASVDCGLTHSYLFALYCFQIYVTIQWHKQPRIHWAFVSGLLIGLAASTRPTDALMLLIPLLWNETSRQASMEKWQLVKKNKVHILIAALGAFIATLPQLIYWRYVTGNWVYDIGSKWVFLNPWWRVLFGWTNGWLIYTPVVAFFILGLFFMRNKPFKTAVIVFFIINTWIVISWSDWTYGATYSCRALVQSYPVMALAFASVLEWCLKSKWRYFFMLLWCYLLAVNLFQVYQYNTGILHYNKMNRAYYAAIYLNPHPSPLDLSLLDTEDRLYDESKYSKQIIFEWKDTTLALEPGRHLLASIPLTPYFHAEQKDHWIRVDLKGVTYSGLWDSYLNSYLNSNLVFTDSTISRSFGLPNALNKENESTSISFYQRVLSDHQSSANYKLFLSNAYIQHMKIKDLTITWYAK